MYHMLIQAVVANLEMTEEMETDECMAVVANLEMTEEMETDMHTCNVCMQWVYNIMHRMVKLTCTTTVAQ